MLEKIQRKSLLYKTAVEYGDYTINHVEGCSHGCLYPCYAFLMAKRFGKIKTYKEWIQPKIVYNALELLDKEIPKYKNDIKFVQLSFTTDPFMYNYPEVSKLSCEIIKKLNDNDIKLLYNLGASVDNKQNYLAPEFRSDDHTLSNADYADAIVSYNSTFTRAIVEDSDSPSGEAMKLECTAAGRGYYIN